MIYYVFSILLFAFYFATTFASDAENTDPLPNAVPLSILRTYPHLKGDYDAAMDAAAAHRELGHQSDEDTGYETHSRGYSSQSSVLAQIGTQTPSPQPAAAVLPLPSFNAPEDDLIAQIRTLSGRGALLLSEPEQGALSDMRDLVTKKRVFINHLKSYMQERFSHIMERGQLAGLTKSLVYQIRYNQKSYFKRKQALFEALRRKGISRAQLNEMDEKVMRPYEAACRERVQRCAASVDIFGDAHSPVRRLRGRRKLASHHTLKDVVLRLDSVLDGAI